MLSPVSEFEETKAQLKDAISSVFPIVGRKQTLRLDAIDIKDDQNMSDFAAQRDAKTRGRSYTIPYNAKLSLVDNETGQIVDKTKMKIVDLPRITERASYIVDGNEYYVPYQMLVKPGIYTRRKENQQITSSFNLSKGRRDKIEMNMDPEKPVFKFTVKSSNTNLYPVLKALGVEDDTMKKAWGEAIFDINVKASKGKADSEILKLYKALYFKDAESVEQAKEDVRKYFDETGLSPETTLRIRVRVCSLSPGLMRSGL